jgi:hypothetical protein
MADPTNPSFETAGAAAGQASGWTEAQSDGGEDTAIFDTDDSGDRPHEDFETQFQEPESALSTFNEDSIEEFEPGDLGSALFDGVAQVENFETKFQEPRTDVGPPFNEQSETNFDSIGSDTAMFDTASQGFEDFEEGWVEPEATGSQASTHKYSDAPNPNSPPPPLGTMDTALFNSGADLEEDFEDATGWGTTKELDPLTATTAQFDGSDNYEDYDNWTSQMVW